MTLGFLLLLRISTIKVKHKTWEKQNIFALGLTISGSLKIKMNNPDSWQGY
jgi:hypothetical protein